MKTGLPQRAASLNCGRCLPSVHALEQNGIDLRTERANLRDELDIPLGLQLFGELVHARPAGFDVRASAFVSRDDSRAVHVIVLRAAVKCFGKCDDMRRIGADDGQAQVGGQRKTTVTRRRRQQELHEGHCTLGVFGGFIDAARLR